MSQALGLDGLMSLVRESATSNIERRALLLRPDKLPASLSRPHHLRRAREAIGMMGIADRARAYDLPGGRMVMTWRGEADRLLRRVVDELDGLLQENPIEAPPLPQLLTFFQLPEDCDALLREIENSLFVDMPPAAKAAPAEAAAEKLEPLDVAALVRLEHSLATADLSRFGRRQPVSAYSAQGMQLAWEERFLSIPELIETVSPGKDPRADPWLFRRLTRLLDRRLLSILSNSDELREAGPFNITLNVASVLSPEFLRFDAALPPGLRGRVVVSFLPVDVATDAGAFAFARNFARSRSYRVCLRAVTSKLLPMLDLSALSLDFIQLVWSTEWAALERLPDANGARWIVGRPCTREAVKWGVSAGLSLFATNPTV